MPVFEKFKTSLNGDTYISLYLTRISILKFAPKKGDSQGKQKMARLYSKDMLVAAVDAVLLEGKTVREASDKSGIPYRTLSEKVRLVRQGKTLEQRR